MPDESALSLPEKVVEIDGQIAELIKRLNFVMQAMKLRVGVPTGMLDHDGKPLMQVQEGSLLDFYLAQGAKDLQHGPPAQSA